MAQTGALAKHSAKERHREAAEKLSSTPEDSSRGTSEADDTVPLEDTAGSGFAWDAVSTPGDGSTRPHISTSPNTDGKPTLRTFSQQ